MATQTKVTAGVLCYNESKDLHYFFKLLLNQTYKNIEIVVSDNGSTDNSKEILLEIKKKNPEIKLNFFKTNIGVTRNLYKVLEMSSAEYFFIVSPNDKIHEKFVEECMKIHQKKEVSSVMCSVDTSYGNKKIDFAGVKNFNYLSAYKQANLIRTYDPKIKNMKLNFFMLGIFNKKILENVLEKPKRQKIYMHHERSILYFSCMYGKLYHLDKFLYTKNLDRKKNKKDRNKIRNDKFLGYRFDFDSIEFILSSIFALRGISLSRKLKFSFLIFKALKYKFKNKLFNTLGMIKKKIFFL